jgi:hypothetical protein
MSRSHPVGDVAVAEARPRSMPSSERTLSSARAEEASSKWSRRAGTSCRKTIHRAARSNRPIVRTRFEERPTERAESAEVERSERPNESHQNNSRSPKDLLHLDAGDCAELNITEEQMQDLKASAAFFRL